MTFFYRNVLLLLVLAGGCSITRINALQTNDKKAVLVQVIEQKQCPSVKAIIFDCGGTLLANTKENIFRILKRLNLEEYFDVIVSVDDLTNYSDPERTNKPKPYIYIEAAKQLGLCPEQCVAIEDSRTGILSAVSAGCIAIAIPNAYTSQQDLSCAHLKITSFVDVTPINFLQTIADLCN